MRHVVVVGSVVFFVLAGLTGITGWSQNPKHGPFLTVQAQPQAGTEDLYKRIEKLLDERIAKLKDEIVKETRAQLDTNNKQILAVALTLQNSLKTSLGEVVERASHFERAVKQLLIQTSMFNDHGIWNGMEGVPCDNQTLVALGLQKGDAFQITKVETASPAEAASLKVGDVIVYSESENDNWLPGDKLHYRVIRKGERLTVLVGWTCKKCKSDSCPFFGTSNPKRILGVRFNYSMVVEAVVAGSVAERAGVKVGDTLLAVADKKIDRGSFTAVLQEVPRQTTVTIKRDGKETILPISWEADEKSSRR